MSIIPIASLSARDLSHLGNNLVPAARKDRRTIRAINSSLAAHDEQVARLYRRLMPMTGGCDTSGSHVASHHA
jgi:hypothetical protein